MAKLERAEDLKKAINKINDLTKIEVKITNKVDNVVKVYEGEYVGLADAEGADSKAELTFRLGKLIGTVETTPYRKNKPGERPKII